MQLQVQQPDLQKMFGQDSLYNTLYGSQQLDQANANQQQNLGQAQQDQSFAAQLQPAKVKQGLADVLHTQALTDNANAATPGISAESGLKQNALATDSSIDQGTKTSAAYKKLAADMSADDFKALTNHIQTQMQDPDPKVRSQAQDAYSHLPNVALEMMKLKQEGANSAGVARINQEGANYRDAADNAAGRYNKNSTAYLMMKGFQGNFQQQAGAWTMKAMADEAEGDTKGAQQAYQIADLARKSDHDARAAAAYTNLVKSPDFAALGIAPAVPAANAAPQAPAAAAAIANPGAPAVPGMTPPVAPQSSTVTVTDSKGNKHVISAEGVKHLPPGWKAD